MSWWPSGIVSTTHRRNEVCTDTIALLGLSGMYLCHFRERADLSANTRRQAAFDSRVLASVCFFATDIHTATLGKGKSDDTLVRVRKGDLNGKGELVVRLNLGL